jgi:hypothetical protein
LWTRAAIGPISGQLVLLAGVTFHATWITIAIVTFRNRRGAGRNPTAETHKGPAARARTRSGANLVSADKVAPTSDRPSEGSDRES